MTTTDPEELRRRDEAHQRRLAIMSGRPDPFYSPPKEETPPESPKVKSKPTATKKGRQVRELRGRQAASAGQSGSDLG